ncbi:MAG: hypothetical protein C4324_09650, partial [Blastocatellia bacterium]
AAAAQKLEIRYTVSIADAARHQFHITTEIAGIRESQLDLSLPVWAPGWYVVENYAKNVGRFTVTDAEGKRIQPRMLKKQVWRVPTKGRDKIRVDFDYRADVLGLNQAKIGDDFAFFTGIQLFLEPLGHRNNPSTLRIELPAGWKIITPLEPAGARNTFKAENYDVLVDAPVLIGAFDITEFQVEDKPHYLAAYPAGSFSAEKSKQFTGMLARTIKAQSAIFGGLPYSRYVAFYFFRPAESNASGALEHLNSYVAFAPAGANSTPEGLIGTGSHEFFHLWNVKRIRPAEMWPYNYTRENETPLLWFSEGFTNYYGVLSTYRAGITSKQQFIASVAGAAAGVENTEARNYISPADSSVSTWLGYDTPLAFGISYYTQGQNLAALLDLSIRNDTSGKASLDDVFRVLYNEHYLRGRGFTSEELIAHINRITGRDYRPFFDDYVFGVKVPNYEKIFSYAGLRLERKQQTTPDFGFATRPRGQGLTITGIEPAGAAAEAGLRVGDTITKIDGVSPFEAGLGGSAGKTLNLTVLRSGQEMDLKFTPKSRQFTQFILTEVDSPTPEQLRIREGWLRR